MDDYASNPRDVFERLSRGFARFAEGRAVAAFDVAIGPGRIRVRVAGAGLEALLRERWGHLMLPPGGGADGRIDLWSSPDAALPVARPPESQRWGRLVGDRERRFLHDWRPCSDAAIDLSERHIVGHFPDPARLTDDESAKPLHRLVGGLITPMEAAMVHAALVGRAGDAVLLAGPGGSGKSTTALACRQAGMEFYGDDYMALSVGDKGVTGHSLYASAMIGEGRVRLPMDVPARNAVPPADGKRLVRIAAAARRAPVVAILLPHVGAGRETRLTRARPGDFLRAAAPHSLLANAQDRTVAMDVMARAASRVPVWKVALGDDLEGVVATVRRTLAERGAP